MFTKSAKRFEDLISGFWGMSRLVELEITANGVLDFTRDAVDAAAQLFFGQRRIAR